LPVRHQAFCRRSHLSLLYHAFLETGSRQKSEIIEILSAACLSRACINSLAIQNSIGPWKAFSHKTGSPLFLAGFEQEQRVLEESRPFSGCRLCQSCKKTSITNTTQSSRPMNPTLRPSGLRRRITATAYIAMLLVFVASTTAQTFYPGVVTARTWTNMTTRLAAGGGPPRSVSVNTDPIDDQGILLGAFSADSGAIAGAAMIAYFTNGTTVAHAGGALNNVLAGNRLIFFDGTREAVGMSGDTAGVMDLTADGRRMFLNSVAFMAGAGKTNVLWISQHPTDNSPTAAAAANGFTNAPDKGYTELLRTNGYRVTRALPSNIPNASAVSTNDVIILGRSVGSGIVQNANADQWNAVAKPIIVTSGFHGRHDRGRRIRCQTQDHRHRYFASHLQRHRVRRE
jgi:hypothetical protein